MASCKNDFLCTLQLMSLGTSAFKVGRDLVMVRLMRVLMFPVLRQSQGKHQFTVVHSCYWFPKGPDIKGTIHSTKNLISGNFGPKLNESARSNRKSFEKTGPPFKVDHFPWLDWSEVWLSGWHPTCKCFSTFLISRLLLHMHHMYVDSIHWDFH